MSHSHQILASWQFQKCHFLHSNKSNRRHLYLLAFTVSVFHQLSEQKKHAHITEEVNVQPHEVQQKWEHDTN